MTDSVSHFLQMIHEAPAISVSDYLSEGCPRCESKASTPALCQNEASALYECESCGYFFVTVIDETTHSTFTAELSNESKVVEHPAKRRKEKEVKSFAKTHVCSCGRQIEANFDSTGQIRFTEKDGGNGNAGSIHSGHT